MDKRQIVAKLKEWERQYHKDGAMYWSEYHLGRHNLIRGLLNIIEGKEFDFLIIDRDDMTIWNKLRHLFN